MSDVVVPKVISSLDDLDETARQAAAQLTKVSGENAVWDKALKALKPVLAGLPSIRTDAQMEATQTDAFVNELKGNYSSLLTSVQTASDAIKKNIQDLQKKLTEAENSLMTAKRNADDAQKALDESMAKFDAAQKKLLGLPKQIQEGKKALVALKAEVKEAHDKKQKVEAVIKLQDLSTILGDFNKIIVQDYETPLWAALEAAAREVLQKTKDLHDAQDKISPEWNNYNNAKTPYEGAQKNRLDNIKKQVEKGKTGEANVQNTGKGQKSKS